MDHLLNARRILADRIKSASPVRRLFEGNADPSLYIRYLLNVYGYSQHSPRVIALAASRTVNSHPELSRYLLHHAEEEQGHHLWALDDLSDLGVEKSTVTASYPDPACAAMVGFVYYTAGYANPIGLFGWLYVLEAMGDDLGALIANALNERLGLDGKALRFVAGHGVNDVEHTVDLTEQISTRLTDPGDIAAVNHVADVTTDLYARMFEELAN